jgi:hypothetical protein
MQVFNTYSAFTFIPFKCGKTFKINVFFVMLNSIPIVSTLKDWFSKTVYKLMLMLEFEPDPTEKPLPLATVSACDALIFLLTNLHGSFLLLHHANYQSLF